jgi:tRNA-Thr(GGU) m(6)t(6)A37 methyltransferase TsaA
MKKILTVKPIGVVHSPFKSKDEDIHSQKHKGVGEIEIHKKYADGLSGIDGCSHIIVIFWLHQAQFSTLKVRPHYYPEKLRGVFATRSPHRPNPLGMTVVELVKRRKNVLTVRGIDMIDGTPVLDIKPYTKHDKKHRARCTWMSDT